MDEAALRSMEHAELISIGARNGLDPEVIKKILKTYSRHLFFQVGPPPSALVNLSTDMSSSAL
jgi:hypothetical protein